MYRWCICGIGKKMENANLRIMTYQSDCSWWFQPIWKISVKLDHFPNYRGENSKNIWVATIQDFIGSIFQGESALLARLIGSSLRIPTILILTCDGPTSNKVFTGIHIDPIWALYSIYRNYHHGNRGHESLPTPNNELFIRDLKLPYICIVSSPQNW